MNTQAVEDHGETFLLTCTSCHAKTRMHLIKKSSSYFWLCPNCHDETILTKKQFGDIQRTLQTFRDMEKELG